MSRLGSGGMGSVYLARDGQLGRGVALKLLRAPVFDRDDDVVARFLREARATASLSHQNIVRVYEIGRHERQPFIAMEYVAGNSLADLIRERAELPVAVKISYLEQICAGLHFAHAANIIHRDIKPANIMVDAQGVIRIVDFGIARLEGSVMTGDGALMGTLNYMSPEQMLGRPVDHRTDIFAVGAVAYELVACQQAFPGTIADGLLDRLPNEAPHPLASLCPAIDPRLEEIVGRALEKRPEDRFQDLARMQHALAAVRQSIEAHGGGGIVLPTRVSAPTPGRAGASVAEDPKSVRALLDEALKALEEGDFATAIAIGERVAARTPSSTEAHMLLLRAHQAIASARDAAAPTPRSLFPTAEDDQIEQEHRPRTSGKRLGLWAGLGVAMAAAIVAAWMGLRWSQRDGRSSAASSVGATAGHSRRIPRESVPLEDPPARPVAAPEPPSLTADLERTETTTRRSERTAAVEESPGRSRQAENGREFVPIDRVPSSAVKELDEANRAATDDRGPDPPPGFTSVPVDPAERVSRELPAVLATLGAYRAAYQRKSMAALRRIYPGVDRDGVEGMERSFDGCRALDVEFEDARIAVHGDIASVQVISTYICTPHAAPASRNLPVKEIFRLEKAREGWVITRRLSQGTSTENGSRNLR